MSWNPFSSGVMEVHYTVRNTGNSRLVLAPAVMAAVVRAPADPAAAGMELLPGEQRQVTLHVAGVWPVALAPVEVELSGHGPATLAGQGQAVPSFDSLRTRILVAAVPWSQSVVAVGLALLMLGTARRRRRRQAQVEQLIAEARMEGMLSSQLG